jgi:hypothetical protein
VKLRWWPHTSDPVIASTRLRCLRIIDWLRARGVDAGLYTSGDSSIDVLVLAKRYDAPSVAAARRIRDNDGTTLVLDLCDNHFFATDPESWSTRAAALRGAVAAVDRLIVSTEQLARVVASECPNGPPIEVIGDAVELPAGAPWNMRRAWPQMEVAALAWKLRKNGVPKASRLVWFGNHGSPNAPGGMLDVLDLAPVLHNAFRSHPLTLTIVSNDSAKFRQVRRALDIPTHYIAWNRATFSRVLGLHGTALIPIRLNPFSMCKTSNRVETALLHGLSVIADRIPSYDEFAAFIDLGDWPRHLEAALGRGDATDARVSEGVAYIHRERSIDRVGADWLSALSRAVSTRS